MNNQNEVDAEIKIKLINNGWILKSGKKWDAYTDPESLLAMVRTLLFSMQKDGRYLVGTKKLNNR